MVIYLVTNNVNEKVYVGQTSYNLEKRKQQHKSKLNYGTKTKLYNAMRKYGWENFQFTVLCEVDTVDDLNLLEVFFIDYYDSCNNGYNMTYGGQDRHLFSEEAKKNHLTKMRSAETREKISQTMRQLRKDKGFSQETRQKLAEKAKGNQKGKGKIRPQSAIDATSKALHRQVCCKDIRGEIVSCFDSVKNAANWWHINGYETATAISLMGYIKKSAVRSKYIAGLLWVYG